MKRPRLCLQEQYFDQNRQYSWMGDGAFIMHDVLENGTMVQCVISPIENEAPPDRKRALTREILNEALESLARWANC